MSIGRIKHSKGFSLIEVMVAILILSIAVIGTSGYRYYTALDARKADMQATAARVALMLCESWGGLKVTKTTIPQAISVRNCKLLQLTILKSLMSHPLVLIHWDTIRFY